MNTICFSPCKIISPTSLALGASVMFALGVNLLGCIGQGYDGGYCPKNISKVFSFAFPNEMSSSSSSGGGGGGMGGMGGMGGGNPSGVICPSRDEALGIFKKNELQYGVVDSVDSDGTYLDGQCSYQVTTVVNTCSA